MSSNANEDASPVNVGNVGRKYGKIAAEISKLSDEEMMDVLAQQPIELFTKFKELDEEIAKRFYSSFKDRWEKAEARIPVIEKRLMDLKYEDNSLEEGRFEILGELLDKAAQSFEVFDEHEKRKIPFGHRLVLEARLLGMINSEFDLIEKTCDNFDELRGDKYGVDNERDELRFEIRFCDMRLTEIHERFLKSYLDMEW